MNLFQILAGRDDHVVVRQRAMAQVVDRRDLAIGLHDPVGQLGQLFFEAEIGGHDLIILGVKIGKINVPASSSRPVMHGELRRIHRGRKCFPERGFHRENGGAPTLPLAKLADIIGTV